jgi:TPR repeat protein
MLRSSPSDPRCVRFWGRRGRRPSTHCRPDLGQAWAENGLGNAYLNGLGVPKSNETALVWFSKAAAQNYPGGEMNLGQMYENGLAVGEDPARAAALYRRGAEQGRAAGWSLLKRLCDNNSQLSRASCAGIPAGTTSAPMFDFKGHPELIWPLFIVLGKIGLGCAGALLVAVFLFFRFRRAATNL